MTAKSGTHRAQLLGTLDGDLEVLQGLLVVFDIPPGEVKACHCKETHKLIRRPRSLHAGGRYRRLKREIEQAVARTGHPGLEAGRDHLYASGLGPECPDDLGHGREEGLQRNEGSIKIRKQEISQTKKGSE